MKIRTEHLEQLREEQQLRRKQTESAATSKFGDLLAKEVDKASGANAQAPVARLGADLRYSPQTSDSSMGAVPTEGRIMENMDALLDQWEMYAQQLESPAKRANLREAYSVLEQISQTVSELKQDVPKLAATNPSLESMVNELEVLTVTETFKFNRGDYS